MVSLVKDILIGRGIPLILDHTHVTLIPKVNTPTNIMEFRPISLCNVAYKLAMKFITNRLKKILPQIISETQSAFTSGILIIDNILISYEVFHSMLS